MRRIVPPLFAIGVIAGLVWLYRTAQKFDPAPSSVPPRQASTLPEISIRFGNATVINRTAGIAEWKVKVDRIDVHRPAGGDLDQLRSADFTGIRDGVLFRDGKREAGFSARSASYDYFAGRFDVRGAIKVSTVRGDSLRSELLQWSQRDDYLRFPQGGSGTFRGSSLKAPWLLYQPRKRIVDCPQGAEGVFNGHPARASNLYWNVGKQFIEFRGPVSGERKGVAFTARSGTLNLKTRELRANKARLVFRIEGESFEEALH